MKYLLILMIVLCIVNPVQAEWNPVDGDAVLKNVAKEDVEGLRSLQVSFAGTQPVLVSGLEIGTVEITFPAVQTVDFDGAQPVSGTVAVSNLPATQNVKEVGTWGDELQKPAGFTGAMTVAFSNSIEEATITNLSSTVTLYYSPVNPASTGSFAIQPLQTFSFKTGKTDFYIYFPSTGTCQLHGSYRN